MITKKLDESLPMAGGTYFQDRKTKLLALDATAQKMEPDLTPGPDTFVLFDGTVVTRVFVPTRWAKEAGEREALFLKECRLLTAVLLENLSQSIRQNLELDPEWASWVQNDRIDHLWERVCKYMTSHSTTMAGQAEMSITMVQDFIELVNYKQGTTPLGEYTVNWSRMVNDLVDKGFKKSLYEPILGHSFLVSVNQDEYGEALLRAQRQGDIKSGTTSSEAIEMVRRWEDHARVTRRVIGVGGGAKGGSTTANSVAAAPAGQSTEEVKALKAANANLANQLKQAKENKARLKAGGKPGGGGGDNGKGNQGGGKKKHCSFCHQDGHWLTECQKLTPEQRAEAEEARQKGKK